MTRTSLENYNCSLARCADIIGDKWTLLIIRDAFFGASTFSQFQRSLNIARNILANRLDALVQHKILEKTPTKPGTQRFTYHLSESGFALMPVLLSITQWGDDWVSGEGNEPVQFVDSKHRQPIRKLVPISANGSELGVSEVIPSPGPGADKHIENALAAFSSSDKNEVKRHHK